MKENDSYWGLVCSFIYEWKWLILNWKKIGHTELAYMNENDSYSNYCRCPNKALWDYWIERCKKINRRKNNILHVVGQVPSTIFSTLLKSQNIELKHTRMTVLLHRFEPEEISWKQANSTRCQTEMDMQIQKKRMWIHSGIFVEFRWALPNAENQYHKKELEWDYCSLPGMDLVWVTCDAIKELPCPTLN